MDDFDYEMLVELIGDCTQPTLSDRLRAIPIRVRSWYATQMMSPTQRQTLDQIHDPNAITMFTINAILRAELARLDGSASEQALASALSGRVQEYRSDTGRDLLEDAYQETIFRLSEGERVFPHSTIGTYMTIQKEFMRQEYNYLRGLLQ